MLRSRFSWIIPLAAVALSDTLIPNSRTTMLYVWSAWLVIGLGNQYFSSKRAFVSKTGSKNNRIAGAVALGGLVLAAAFSGRIFSPIGHLLSPFSLIVLAALMVAAVLVLSRSFPKLALGLGLGIGSTLFFFAATNFGVWMEGWYPMTAQGLVTCYIRALPFLERQLRATVILVPAAILAGEAVVRVLAKSAVHSPVTHKV